MSSLPCPPELWPRFSTLLDSALELPAPERPAWLERLDGEDAALKPCLARVLDTGTRMETGFLTTPPKLPPETPFEEGMVVGPYRLESRLGEGGMGEVWRASRADEGPRREVALKLPHADLLGGPFRQRFARERDVLAALSHPHIAQIYDAGLSADGHPYLALELVEGEPITVACQAGRAGLQRRLELMCQVLDALMFAHQRLIVHRDIKPSNVLVTPEGGVKLLDFGIAKLLRPDGSDAFPVTGASRLATPGYAAPEQMHDGPITVATDIFAVGVLLFELCTGHRPFPRVPMSTDAAPAPPASTMADPAASGAPEGSGVARLLRGDMDAVMAQALALNPAERYGSAEAFARDLQNCLAGRPVSARRIGWATRGKKFAVRNKLGVGLAATLVLTVGLGTAGIAWQAGRAEREAASARREADRATAIKDFLLELFQQADPRNGAAIRSMTAKQLLDSGVDRADAAFAKQPETEIELLASLGAIYEPIDIARSVSIRKRRLALARKLHGADDPRVVEDTIELSATLSLQKDVPAAAALLEDIRAPLLARFGPASHQRAEWLMAHADIVRVQHHGAARAEADDLAAIDILEKHFPGSIEYPQALQDLATNQYFREEFAADLANTEKMRQVEIATHTYDSIEALQYGDDIATALENVGQSSAADAAYQAQLERAEKLVGKDSPYYRYPLIHRAELLHMRGDRAQADQLFATADVLLARPGSPNHTTFNRLYGNALLREGRAADAIPRLQDALAASRASKSAYVTRVYDDERSLGEAYAAVGRAADARKLLADARADWIDELGPASLHALAAREAWARLLLAQGDTAGATAELNAILDDARGTPSAAAALAAADLAELAIARGDTAQSDARSADALHWIEATSVEYDARNRIDVWLARAAALAAVGKPAEARAMSQQAVTAAEQYDAPVSPQLARARDTLAKQK